MFRFEHPEYLWWFVVVPILLGLWFLATWWSTRQAHRFATFKALGRLLEVRSERMSILRVVLVFLSLSLLCMSLANPQWGTQKSQVQAQSADIFIALDISTSMDARDIAPSRMERAKKFGTDLVQSLRGERIGLILFAGNAYLQMPLTTDYAAAELFIRSAHPGLATTQGTAIGEAIDLALRAYPEEDAHQRALVIITDGENHEEGASDAMARGRDAGLIPFLIAVGTSEGALIPVTVQGKEDYKRDQQGQPVRSAVDEVFLRDLARAGRGHQYHILDAEFVIRDIGEKIAQLSKREMEQRSFKDFESYYQYFLFGAILLLCLATVLPERRSVDSRYAYVS